jgi:Phage tail lysozyme
MTTNGTQRRQALEFFVKQGWTPEQSAGIVANLVAESALRPDAVGDGGQAYGIAQWHPPRQAGFEALLGKPIQGSSFEDQLYWVHAELQSTEKAAGTALAGCSTPAEAGACVSRRYERPADREGEAAKRAALAETIFIEYGGTLAVQDAVGGAISPEPIPTPPDAPESPVAPDLPLPRPEKPMFAALLPILLGLIPQLAPVLGPKTAGKVEQYGQLAAAITAAITQATGTSNLQAGLEAMQADPAVKAKTATAVLSAPTVAAVMEAQEAGGGGISGARKANIEAAGIPFWRRGEFLISLLLLAMVWMIVIDVLFVHPTIWSATDRSQVLMLAVAVTSGVMGYWIGSSIGSMRKTEISGGSA